MFVSAIFLPLIPVLCIIGVYSLESLVFDLWIMLVFGLVGYGLCHFDYPLQLLVIGIVLGPICEGEFRRSLDISDCDYGIFLDRQSRRRSLRSTWLSSCGR
jgi:putative tricarboxylic transport membrane protein